MAGTLPDYPTVPGNKRVSVTTILGPAHYATIGIATPPTGGQLIHARDLGLIDIDWAFGSMSNNGQYEAIVCYPNNPVGPVESIRLMWRLAATGAQLANESTAAAALTVRIVASGN